MMRTALLLSVIILLLLGPVQGAIITADKNQTIQSQIERLSPDDTLLVMNGSYYQNIIVDRPIIMQGIDRPVIDGQGNSSAIILAAGGGVLEGFTVTNCSNEGIYIASNDNIIKNNTIVNCENGITVFNSSNNTIEANAELNNSYGIFLDGSRNNMIVRNNASLNQADGIYFLNSESNICNESLASYNEGNGIHVKGSSYNAFDNNSVRNNSKNGFYLTESNANNLTRTTAFNNDYGIYLRYSENNSISESEAANNQYGIRAYKSSNNIFNRNHLYDNDDEPGTGMYIESGQDNRIQGNNASDNRDNGIFIMNSENNIIQDNQANNNNEVGIRLSGINNNVVINNSAHLNVIGIAFFDANDNIIGGNRAESNWKGISLEGGSNNTIIENILQINAAGIILLDSMNNKIEDNNVSDSIEGVSLYRSSYNEIQNNNISQNWIGLSLNRSIDNSIAVNVYDRNTVGIALNMSTNNTIENRTFINNDHDIIINENETISSYPLWMELIVTGLKDLEYLYVFSWTKVPGTDDDRLKEYLGKRYNIDWIYTAGIVKSEDSKTIDISQEDRLLTLALNDEESEVLLKIDNNTTDKFIAKMENGELNIYEYFHEEYAKYFREKYAKGEPSLPEGELPVVSADVSATPKYKGSLIAHIKKTISAALGSSSKSSGSSSKSVDLDVDSDPQGAQIWIDGNKKTKTPSKIILNKRGNHTVELNLSGYESVREEIPINQNMRFYKKLIPISPSSPGENAFDHYIMINSAPEGAIIWIDGNSTGMKTPAKIHLDDREVHTLGLTLIGYQQYSGNISSSNPSIDVDLESIINADSKMSERPIPVSIGASIFSIIFGYYIWNKRKNKINK